MTVSTETISILKNITCIMAESLKSHFNQDQIRIMMNIMKDAAKTAVSAVKPAPENINLRVTGMKLYSAGQLLECMKKDLSTMSASANRNFITINDLSRWTKVADQSYPCRSKGKIANEPPVCQAYGKNGKRCNCEAKWRKDGLDTVRHDEILVWCTRHRFIKQRLGDVENPPKPKDPAFPVGRPAKGRYHPSRLQLNWKYNPEFKSRDLCISNGCQEKSDLGSVFCTKHAKECLKQSIIMAYATHDMDVPDNIEDKGIEDPTAYFNSIKLRSVTRNGKDSLEFLPNLSDREKKERGIDVPKEEMTDEEIAVHNKIFYTEPIQRSVEDIAKLTNINKKYETLSMNDKLAAMVNREYTEVVKPKKCKVWDCQKAADADRGYGYCLEHDMEDDMFCQQYIAVKKKKAQEKVDKFLNSYYIRYKGDIASGKVTIDQTSGTTKLIFHLENISPLDNIFKDLSMHEQVKVKTRFNKEREALGDYTHSATRVSIPEDEEFNDLSDL